MIRLCNRILFNYNMIFAMSFFSKLGYRLCYIILETKLPLKLDADHIKIIF